MRAIKTTDRINSLNSNTQQTLTESAFAPAIQSMTGYALRDCDLTNGNTATEGADTVKLQLELRSVNSRFLDLSFKLPDALRYAEPTLRDLIAKRIKRGKLECKASYSYRSETNQTLSVNQQLLTDLLACAVVVEKQTRETFALAMQASPQLQQSQPIQANPISIGEILRWPGVCQSSAQASGTEGVALDLQTEAIAQSLGQLCEAVLFDFYASRQREGEQTARSILANAEQIEALIQSLEGELPTINKEIHDRFADKVTEKLKQAASEEASKSDDMQGRIHQEIVLLALRADVSEELARLNGHIAELRATLAAGGAMGKKLDFLMQEFNREANTLGSKAQSPVVTKTAMSLKVLIEQIREQVQNLE